jgi:hypothetical protein
VRKSATDKGWFTMTVLESAVKRQRMLTATDMDRVRLVGMADVRDGLSMSYGFTQTCEVHCRLQTWSNFCSEALLLQQMTLAKSSTRPTTSQR